MEEIRKMFMYIYKRNNNKQFKKEFIKEIIIIIIITFFFIGCPSPNPVINETTPFVTVQPTPTLTPIPTLEPDYVDISGKLEDNEINIGQRGIVRVYNNTSGEFIDNFITDSDGYYCSLNKTINVRVSLPGWQEVKPR